MSGKFDNASPNGLTYFDEGAQDIFFCGPKIFPKNFTNAFASMAFVKGEPVELDENAGIPTGTDGPVKTMVP